MIAFGLKLNDKIPYSGSTTHPTFTSPTLSKLWGQGFCLTGEVTADSAAYVSGYTLKKANSRPSKRDKRHPEYVQMSRRPGIGAKWFSQYKSDVFPSSQVVHDGSRYSVPRFYDKLLERENPDLLAMIREDRMVKALAKTLTFAQRRAAAKVAMAFHDLFKKRPLDEGSQKGEPPQ